MRFKTTIVFLSLFFSQFSLAAEDVKVLASIKPLQLIAHDIVGDAGKVELLLKPGTSPHHYSMKPSDRRKLASAGLIVWVGPEMEQFLAKTLRTVKTPALSMMDGMDHAAEHDESEDSGHHEESKHEDHHEEPEHADHHEDVTETDHEHGHDHQGEDLHLWLDPVDVLQFAEVLKDTLSAQYPDHKETFAVNYARFSHNLRTLDSELQQQFLPLKSQGFFVFHDAWSRFVGHYDLKQLGYFTVDPGRKPGARHLTAIRHQLEDEKAVCVFSEPQFKSSIIRAVTSGLSVQQAEIDPLASDAVVTENGYATYIRNVADSVVDCLAVR